MLRSHLTLALRSLFHYKMHSSISVLGLAIGFACFIIVFVFIVHEMSYDAFHENADRLYRVRRDMIEKRMGTRHSYASAEHSMASLLKSDFPEIEDIVRVDRYSYRYGESISVHYQDKHFLEDQIYFVDPIFFDFFSFPLMEGDAQTALEAPYSVVLTEQTAAKYFGSDSPVGKTLRMGIRECLVTGVAQDLPSNTHFKFDFVLPINRSKLRRGVDESWYHTYIRLAENASPEVLKNKLPEFLERHKYYLEEWEKQLFLQPVQDIHLHSHFEDELSPNRDVRYLYLLMGIALVILLIVCINYVNLSTFRFTQRAKEVGLRKALGGVQSQLVQQFLGETLLLTFFAFLVSLVLVLCSWPYVSRFFTDVKIDAFRLATDYGLWLFATIACIGLISGLYPAFFLAKFNPSATLGGHIQSGATAGFLRRTLAIFQFALSIVLLITTLSLRDQLAFMRSHDLGFEQEQVVVIPVNFQPTHMAIAEYLQDPRILNISGTFGSPGVSDNWGWFTPEGQDKVLMNTIDVGYTYLETMGLELVAGRNFSTDFPSDEHDAFIINESAARFLGWKNPVGKNLVRNYSQTESASSKVIGVVKDFHYQSLHHSIEPLVIGLQQNVRNRLIVKHLTVRIDPGDLSGALAFLEAKTREFVIVPDEPFQYYFLDEVFDQFYREEERISRLIGFFSTLSIVIICLGVLGLASFSVEQRMKEIGIRKVLGASSSSLVYLLMKPVLVWLVVANLIAWPIAYMTNQAWLQHFAYRSDSDWWAFLLGSLTQALTVIITIVLQTSKAVQTNPIQTLKSE